MFFLKKNNGITIVTLVITIIVLLILAGISITEGNNLIKKAKTESLITNMIMVKSKSKVYAEETNSKVWDLSNEEKSTKRAEIFQTEYFMSSESINEASIESDIDDNIKSGSYEAYLITNDTLNKMGLSDIGDGENYIVVYNSDDYTKLDIIYKSGIQYNGTTYYTLSKIQSEMGE